MATFVAATFLSASLLFLSEPMVAKLLLPLFGGSPAVWNTCMVFFQTTLLAGYAYAHWSIQRFGLHRQPWIHSIVLLMPLVVLPLTLPAWASAPADQPVWRLLAILVVTIGAPFFVLATSGPLLQRWFAATSHPHAREPYFLYAAGNLGSFIALLAYPFLVEPTLALGTQTVVWTIGYGVFVVSVLMCAALLHRHYRLPTADTPSAAAASTGPSAKPAPTPWRQRLIWLALAGLPSSLMLSVTAHLTLDVAAVPLLWVIPLALYLLTFVISFGLSQPQRLVQGAAPFAAAGVFAALILTTLNLHLPALLTAAIYVCGFTAIALVAHGRLAVSRPAPARLTEFYLWVAAGGMLGGLFNSLVAPVIFNNIYEFPLGLLLALPLLVSLRNLRRTPFRIGVFALGPVLLFLGMVIVSLWVPRAALAVVGGAALAASAGLMYYLYRYRPAAFGIGTLPLLVLPILVLAAQPNLLTERTFYGVIRVQDTAHHRTLLHGITQHGRQPLDPAIAHEPSAYYDRQGPLGDAINLCRALSDCHDLGVVGLGAGMMAAYGRPGDAITFYEIDPAIPRIAYNPQYFTYITGSPAHIETIIGDGRLSLERTSRRHHLLLLDAFSSDAIPTHLLTRQALELYRARLASHGLLAVHISNRQLDLEPVLKATAQAAGLRALVRFDQTITTNRLASKWVILTPDAAALDQLARVPGWRPLGGPAVRPWTDDYSNILDAIGHR